MNLTPAQNEAVTSAARRVCVRAGAGAGKTGVLINRIMHLIETEETTLDRIVAITFTEKAALEMKARLRDACRNRAPKDDPEQLSHWRTVERGVSAARISTIHGFCSGLLREHALHLDSDPDFAMLEEADAHLLRDGTARQGLLRLLQSGDEDAAFVAEALGFEPAYEAMRKFLKSGSETARAVAQMGDGSAGDVRSAWDALEQFAMDRAVRYLRADPRPAEIRSALEVLEGCCENPEDPRELLRVSLIAEIDALSYLKDHSEISALHARLKERAKSAKKEHWSPESAADDVLDQRKVFVKAIEGYLWSSIPEAENTDAIELTGAFIRVYAIVSASYKRAKQSMVTHDFDDLIIRVRQILLDNVTIRDRVARSISHLLMDEFQDTDGLQYDIAQCLHEAGGGPNLFIVGDAKQSIYLFRGAEVETFQDAEKLAENVVLMTDNFRSLPGVLHFVNSFFAETGRLAAVESKYGRLTAYRDPTGSANVEFLIPEDPEDKPNLGEYRRAEADILATRLRDMVDGGLNVGERVDGREIQRPVRYGDMAILFRAMGEVPVYEQSLRRHGVPFTIVAGAGFYERQEIRDLRNFLSVVADAADETALLAFLRSPLAGIADEALIQAAGILADAPTPLSRFFSSDTALSDPEQQARLVRARRLLADTRARREWSAPELLRFVLAETGYEAMLLRQDFLGEQRAGNVRKLVALAESFSHSRTPGLIQFLHYLEDVAKTDLREGEALEVSHDRNAVTIMTIHQSKGLEFPVVAIADTGRSTKAQSDGTVARHRSMGIALRIEDDGGKALQPAAWTCINHMRKWQDRAESARVLYVAMTRAKDYLLIGGPTGGSETWMSGFDRWLGLATRKDGDPLEGDGWRGIVWRRPRTVSKKSKESQTTPTPDAELLRRRIDPIAPTPAFDEIRITALAARLAMDRASDARNDERATRSNPIPLIRGTAAHRLLQLWDFDADTPPPIGALLHGTPLDAEARAQLSDDLESIVGRFRRSELFETLRSTKIADRELPLRWRIDGVYINGVIDARLANGAIVDYKTGAQHASLTGQYEWQLRLYAAALRALTGTSPPLGMLCYLDADDAPCTEFGFTDAIIDETKERISEALAEMKLEAM